jgi:hypothetical protein
MAAQPEVEQRDACEHTYQDRHDAVLSSNRHHKIEASKPLILYHMPAWQRTLFRPIPRRLRATRQSLRLLRQSVVGGRDVKYRLARSIVQHGLG